VFSENVFEGQSVLITGGGSGIGKGIALELGRLGAQVFIASRNQERLDAAVAELSGEGIEAAAFAMDVRDPEQVADTVKAATDRFGKIDILINNAAGNFVCPTEKLSANGWRAVVGIVLDGTFFCSREVGLHMIERGEGGQMLNIVATYAWTGGPGVAPSASAKAGVIALTQTLAVEWAKYGIRVNAVAPGAIEGTAATDQLWAAPEIQSAMIEGIPQGRFGRVEEISRLVAYITSPYADYMTGECVVLDGGEWLGKGLGGMTAQLRTRRDPGAKQ